MSKSSKSKSSQKSSRKPGEPKSKTEKFVAPGLLSGPKDEPEVAATVVAKEPGATAPEKLLTDEVVAMMVGKGLSLEDRKNFHKLTGKSGARVYIAKTRTLSRVDISGLQALEHTSLKEFVYGSVRFQVRTDGPREEVLAAMAWLAEVLDMDRADLEATGKLVQKPTKAKAEKKPASRAKAKEADNENGRVG